MASFRCNRRRFLTATASGLGAAALVAASGDLALAAPKAAPLPPAPVHPRKLDRPGQVVAVHHADALESMAKIRGDVVGQMVDRAVMEFTGKTDLAAAWREVVYPDDIVEIKINTLGKRHNSSNGETVEAIIRGLQAAGIPREHILIYDLYGGHMLSTGYKLFRPDGQTVGFGDQWGYETSPTSINKVKTHLANVLTRVSAVISVPVMKDHSQSGVTGALKNMSHGHVKDPGFFHANGCAGIPHIYAQPKLKDKVRLIVMDGLRLLYDGGPQDNPRAKIIQGTILAATDPVALDTLLYEKVTEQRKKAKLRPIAMPKYLAVAAELGLGTHDRGKIQVKEIELKA